MLSENEWRFALVAFKPSPAREEGRIHMGVILEFVRSDSWVVALAMRSEIAPALLETLDPLSCEVITNRIGLMRQEVAKARNAAREPGEVLALLSKANQWSMHVSAAQKGETKEEMDFDVFGAVRLAEKFVIEIHRRELTWPIAKVSGAGTRCSAVGQPVILNRMNEQSAGCHTLDIPPAWMVPPEVWINPWNGSGR